MKYKKLLLFSLLLLTSTCAFAHGEDVLYTFLLPVIPGITFLVVLNVLQLNRKSKGILFAVYAGGVFLSFYVTGTWPYNDNKRLINLIIGFGPPLISFVAYFMIRRWEKSLRREEIKSFPDDESRK